MLAGPCQPARVPTVEAYIITEPANQPTSLSSQVPAVKRQLAAEAGQLSSIWHCPSGPLSRVSCPPPALH